MSRCRRTLWLPAKHRSRCSTLGGYSAGYRTRPAADRGESAAGGRRSCRAPAVAEQPRPRPPVEAEAAAPKAEPEPEPVQIAPQLSAKDQAAAVRTTTDDIRVAERNLQVVYGRQLSASQNDLVGKIAGFLAQAHEAIRTGDWVRAQNLAQKAQVLSVELVKSL